MAWRKREWRERKEKRAHAMWMSHFISFPCYLNADLDTLSLRSSLFFPLSLSNSYDLDFFRRTIVSIFTVLNAMQGISMSLFVRWIDGARTAASDFLSQSGNKLLLLLSNGTEMPYRTLYPIWIYPFPTKNGSHCCSVVAVWP